MAQYIAANVDYLIIMNSFIKPTLKTGFVDRVLVMAEMQAITPIILINKRDLVQEQDYQSVIDIYSGLGYHCLGISAIKDDLKEKMQLLKQKISVMIGYSGVGKSTFINNLLQKDVLQVKAISAYSQKGVHTTSTAEWLDLPFGGAIIDTPGVREFAIYQQKDYHLADFFVEIRHLSHLCSYSTCTHTHEPDCAVKQAVEQGEISASRYQSYLRLLQDN